MHLFAFLNNWIITLLTLFHAFIWHLCLLLTPAVTTQMHWPNLDRSSERLRNLLWNIFVYLSLYNFLFNFFSLYLSFYRANSRHADSPDLKRVKALFSLDFNSIPTSIFVAHELSTSCFIRLMKVLAVASAILSITLPTKPSATITSTLPSKNSLASMYPLKLILGVLFSNSKAPRTESVPLTPSVPIFSKATFLRFDILSNFSALNGACEYFEGACPNST